MQPPMQPREGEPSDPDDYDNAVKRYNSRLRRKEIGKRILVGMVVVAGMILAILQKLGLLR